MKVFISLILLVLLTGCSLFQRELEIRREIVPTPLYPPDIYTINCYPNRPQTAVLGDLIVIQSRALDQCNDQLKNIREWKREMIEIYGEQQDHPFDK